MKNNYRDYLFDEFFNFVGLYSRVSYEEEEQGEKLFVENMNLTETYKISLDGIPTQKSEKVTDKDILEMVAGKLEYEENIDKDLLDALPMLIDVFCKNQLLQSAITIKMNIGDTKMQSDEGDKFFRVGEQMQAEPISEDNLYAKFAKAYSFYMANEARRNNKTNVCYDKNELNEDICQIIDDEKGFVKAWELRGDNYSRITIELGKSRESYDKVIDMIKDTPYASEILYKFALRLEGKESWENEKNQEYKLSYKKQKNYKNASALGRIAMQKGDYEEGKRYFYEAMQFLDKQKSLEPEEQEYYIFIRSTDACYERNERGIKAYNYINSIKSMLVDAERSSKFYELIYGDVKDLYRIKVLSRAMNDIVLLYNYAISSGLGRVFPEKAKEWRNEITKYEKKARELANSDGNRSDAGTGR